MSSAKSLGSQEEQLPISFIFILKRKGPRTDICITPQA